MSHNFHLGARMPMLILFFLSGFAGLVYEVLWMKELGLLFGNTAQAAATTLAAFFLGISAGGQVFGRIAERSQSPLRLYALLEAGIAATTLLYFALLGLYHLAYSELFQLFGRGDHPLFLLAKFLLALGILFPPAFFMGGTLPAMGQYLVRSRDRLGSTVAMLYALNTAGAAAGAFSAGLLLPRLLGFDGAYVTAIALTTLVAGFAWLLAQPVPGIAPPPAAATADDRGARDDPPLPAIRVLAFGSGAVTLALQVLWTRMLAQVLQNSVYTFSIILVTFLLALAAGAGLARWLINSRFSPIVVMFSVMSAGGVLAAVSPFLFYRLTDGLDMIGLGGSWTGYLMDVFTLVMLVIGPATVLLGALFPYLMRVAERQPRGTGSTIGHLAAVNTLGAVCGSLVAGFLLLDLLGLWRSIQLVAAAYIAVGLLALFRPARLRPLAVPALGLALVLLALDASGLPQVTLDPERKRERLVQLYEDSAATVAVVTRGESLRIKVNNYYGLGGTGDHRNEERQAHLPLLIHPDPKRVFFLGLGTGITAGAALQHPDVEQLTAVEILPNVVRATREHFGPWLHGLYTDPRARVLVEDGRNWLAGTPARYDLIVADLFVPWKAGTGSLYSIEHYRTARERLDHGGIYAQWLPLFQLSREEFDIIARTMLAVFPQVTLWRSKFHARVPIALLAGHMSETPLDLVAAERRLRRLHRDEPARRSPNAVGVQPAPADATELLLHYAGNLSAARALFDGVPLNTDNWPRVEYDAPITHIRKKAGELDWFRGPPLLEFHQLLQRITPPEQDPYLAGTPPSAAKLVRAGLALHHARVYRRERQPGAVARAMQDYRLQQASARPLRRWLEARLDQPAQPE